MKLLCQLVQERLLSLTTFERTINKRNGKIYLDYLKNLVEHTIASIQSVRSIEKAPFSASIY
nr:hypothetical protein [Maribacter caenipelagi]